MRIIILGASRFGRAIAEQLIDAEHEVIVIDKSRDRLERLADQLDCGMLEGDGTMPTTLREVFRDENDVFVAVTNASEDNILAALVARSVGYGRVIPQIVSSELMKVCTELELNDAINPHATVAADVAEAMQDRAEIDHDTSLSNQLAIKCVHVPACLDGRPLQKLDLPENCQAVALIRDADESFVEDDTELAEDDQVLFVLERDKIDALADVFRTSDSD
ncbi:potassium uptake system protein TrkA (plasmid) [Dinoroseobacter shibae DFL 12 = DSM 16493]|jgi:trk system potassium uptake protein TrkA|uniref:Trk system potassium uptake protein TrkA n=1 Tax=Dinoroseobacter shibae (strain DSM 16493 / NCIMB 14021 / DFL 12) TaxID=398580 RepID=A8LTS4_DINSH|nr:MULTISPECIES: NAD-binding protein [Dinoroseobacter]ABV95641.1 potassium uptake system protein TrkA [Dinoroseobacter shibae DFL 12 = DSM 16493]MDD9719014.1 NAD-binding protein [Dinoroseobacter sp. PD6]URF48849.1 NAD-binding protein [Dinoroseobacter shibae]URF53161.1 NAD-binding protein [Dinoroseobacter shibae]